MQLIELPQTAISTWGSALVFVNVLLSRLGIPIPAVPLMLFAGVAIVDHRLTFWHVLAAAVLGALIGDGVWFTAGRLFGRRLIHGLARISVTVESRIRKARALFVRFGPPIVAVSKFVPGLAIITPPLMGTTRINPAIFFLWDTLGITTWASFWLLGGTLFERHLRMLLDEVKAHGGTIIDVLVALCVTYLLYRIVQRWRVQPPFALVRITPERLEAMLRPATPPMILDARPEPLRLQEPYQLPDVMNIDLDSLDKLDEVHVTRNTVFYCVCSDDATAQMLSQQLREKGFRRIRAIRGGLDAWERRGYAVGSVPSRRPRSEQPSDDAPFEPQHCEGVTLRGIAPRRAMSA